MGRSLHQRPSMAPCSKAGTGRRARLGYLPPEALSEMRKAGRPGLHCDYPEILPDPPDWENAPWGNPPRPDPVPVYGADQ